MIVNVTGFDKLVHPIFHWYVGREERQNVPKNIFFCIHLPVNWNFATLGYNKLCKKDTYMS